MIASAFEEQRQRIGDDREAARRAAGERRRIVAEPGRVLALERAGQREPVRLVDRAHDHAAHAAAAPLTMRRKSAMSHTSPPGCGPS